MTDSNSIHSLIEWLGKQGPMTQYDYGDSKTCLLARYYRAMGYKVESMGTSVFFDYTGGRHELPTGFNLIAMYGRGVMGDALSEARMWRDNNA